MVAVVVTTLCVLFGSQQAVSLWLAAGSHSADSFRGSHPSNLSSEVEVG